MSDDLSNTADTASTEIFCMVNRYYFDLLLCLDFSLLQPDEKGDHG